MSKERRWPNDNAGRTEKSLMNIVLIGDEDHHDDEKSKVIT